MNTWRLGTTSVTNGEKLKPSHPLTTKAVIYCGPSIKVSRGPSSDLVQPDACIRVRGPHTPQGYIIHWDSEKRLHSVMSCDSKTIEIKNRKRKRQLRLNPGGSRGKLTSVLF